MFFIPQFGLQAKKVPLPLMNALQRKNIVFTVATGRSGTNFFAELFKLCPDTHSLHEPDPNFGRSMAPGSKNVNIAIKFLVTKKLPAIAAISEVNYVETSHLFCQAFLSPLLALGIKPSILFIKRRARDVAKSFYEIGSIPDRTQLGRRFMLSPYSPSVLTLTDIESLHDYQLCYWFALEIYARAYLYKKVLSDNSISYHEVDMPGSLNLDALLDMLSSFNLQPPADLSKLELMLNTRINAKTSLKNMKAQKLDRISDQFDSLESELLNSIVTMSDSFKKHIAQS